MNYFVFCVWPISFLNVLLIHLHIPKRWKLLRCPLNNSLSKKKLKIYGSLATGPCVGQEMVFAPKQFIRKMLEEIAFILLHYQKQRTTLSYTHVKRE